MNRPLSATQVAMLRRAAAHPWGIDVAPRVSLRRGDTGWWRTARSLAKMGYALVSSLGCAVTPEGRDAAARSDK